MTDEPKEDIELTNEELAASDCALDTLRQTDPRFKSPWKKDADGKEARPADPPADNT